MQQRDFILRMIERFGQMLVALRKLIFGGGEPEAVESALQEGSQQMGLDLDLIRGFTLESLVMFVRTDGEIEVDRAWLMAEILLLDGVHAARIDDREHARESLVKARALYDLVGPAGAMLVGIPDIEQRIAEIDGVLGELSEGRRSRGR